MDEILIVVGVLVAGLLAAGLTYRVLERRRRAAREALESVRRQREASRKRINDALGNLDMALARYHRRALAEHMGAEAAAREAARKNLAAYGASARAKSWPEQRQSIATEARQSISKSTPLASLRDAPHDGFPGVRFGEPLGDVYRGSHINPMWIGADSHVPSPSYAGRGGESGGAGASASWDSSASCSSSSSTDSGSSCSSSGSTD